MRSIIMALVLVAAATGARAEPWQPLLGGQLLQPFAPTAAALPVADRVQLSGTFLWGDTPLEVLGLSQARVDGLVRLVRPRDRLPLAISVGTGYQSDATLDHALAGVLDARAQLGRVELTMQVRAAHYFRVGRDPVDVLVATAALVRAAGWLRVGAEYVGEELEGAFADDGDNASGGRHYLGATAALQLAGGQLRLRATAGTVMTGTQLGPSVRGSLAYQF